MKKKIENGFSKVFGEVEQGSKTNYCEWKYLKNKAE